MEQTAQEILQETVDENSHKWTFEEEEYRRRLELRMSHYENSIRDTTDDFLSEKVKAGYSNAPDMAAGVQKLLKSHYALIPELCRIGAGGYIQMVFQKPSRLVANEKKQLQKEVEAQYRADLEQMKEQFIDELMAEVEADLAQADAEKLQRKHESRVRALRSILN